MDTPKPNPSSSATRRESGVVQRIRASLRRQWPEQTVPHILIGCSGGKDSVVLATLIQGLARTGVVRASIVHVDHQVRADSGDAAKLVEQLGVSLGMDVHTETLDEGITERHPGAGPEEALRRERYQVFANVASRIGADAIALAHHQQDQAETVLLHLIRGAGLHGASGMREWTRINVPWWIPARPGLPLLVWRPLLAESAESIATLHREGSLPVAEDETNQDRAYRRNAVRHDILPQLEAISPGATASLARFADLASVDDAYLEELAGERLLLQPDGDLHRTAIIDAAPAIQRRVARQWVLQSGFDGDLTSDRIDAICDIAERNRSGAIVQIGNHWSVTINGGVLSVRRLERVV